MISLFASETAEKSPHVSLPAEELFTIGGFPFTNSLVLGIIGYALVIWMFFWVAGKVKREEKNRFASMVQWLFEVLYKTVHDVIGDEKTARRVAPLAITIFFFVLIHYWLGILPVANAVSWNGVPIFRSLVADLNVTFALAVITMVSVQVYAVRRHGFFGNIGRYLRNPFKDVVGAFEGILEFIAEFSRFVGLSFRLFGNVFAGEILLMMIAFLTVYATPVFIQPFYVFELFIGTVQAYIFFMLTIVFISLGLATHGHEEHETDHSPPEPKLPETALAGGNEK